MKATIQLTIMTLVFLLFAGMANAYTITGNVEGVGVGPLGNATITVINFTTSLSVNTTMTNATGDYSVDIPDDARLYQIRASAPAFMNSTRVDYINSNLTRDFSLGPLNPIVNVTGHITDQASNDLPGANVRAVLSSSTLSSDITDGSGNYLLPVVNDTTYDIYVTMEGYTMCTVLGLHVTGNTANVDCQLIQTSPWGTVDGYVRNAANMTEMIANAQVTLTVGVGVVATATTDLTGYYTMNAPQNDYDISATATGFEEGTGIVSVFIGVTTQRNFSLNPVLIPVSCTDADGDGYYAEAGCGTAVDCNDANNAIHPGATEIKNGIDDDCDGTIDEGFGGSSYIYYGGGSGGGGGGGWSYDETGIDLSGCTQTVTTTFNDKLVYYYKGTRYEFLVQSVTASIVKMRLFPPPSRDFQWNLFGEDKQFIDLDRSGDEDLMVYLMSIERNKATIQLKDLHCTGDTLDYQPPTSTEEPVEEEEVEEAIVERFKEGILNIVSDFIPSKRASPLLGGAIALGIVLLGLAGFAGYRKHKNKKPKDKPGYSFDKK